MFFFLFYFSSILHLDLYHTEQFRYSVFTAQSITFTTRLACTFNIFSQFAYFKSKKSKSKSKSN